MARSKNSGAPVVAVISQKGGCGKTTIATSIAAASHLEGRRTLVVDTDPQGSALDWYHSREDGSKLDGLNVVRFEKPPSEPKLNALAKGYDLVVVDTPPQLAATARNAAVLADLVVMPVEPAYFNLWALGNTNEALDEADDIRETMGKSPAKRCVVLNRVEARRKVTELAIEELRKRRDYLDTPIRKRTAFVLASGRGESVLTTSGSSSAADDVRALWKGLKRRMRR